MTKTKLAAYATALMFAVTLSAQKYSITVETHIAGRPEDKFKFVLSEGESQYKGFDGKGYPEGLEGEQIPLVARIICVADSFDAMNSDRCYRKRLTREEIEREITQNRGTQFDPEIADCLLQLLQDGEIMCERMDGIQE